MPNDNQFAPCRACDKLLAHDARMCPYCGENRPVAPSPLVRIITWAMGLSAAALITIASIAAYESEEYLSSVFLVGRTYPVAKLGPVCTTINRLTDADHNRVTTLAQADHYGCVVVAPQNGFSLTMLEKNAALVKVRVNAPGLDADKFEGWTKAENVTPQG